MSIAVSNDNFVRAETNRMFADLPAGSPGLNQWSHNRELTPLESRPSSGSTATRCTASRSSTSAPARRSRCPSPATATCR